MKTNGVCAVIIDDDKTIVEMKLWSLLCGETNEQVGRNHSDDNGDGGEIIDKSLSDH